MAKKPIFHEAQDFTSYVSGRRVERSRLSVSDSPPGKYFRLRLSFDWSKSGTREKNFKSRFHQRTQENCSSLLWGFSLWARWTKKHKLLKWKSQIFSESFCSFPRRDQEKAIFCQTVISDFDWSVQLAWMSSVRWQHEMNSSKWLFITETSIMG